MIHEGYCIECGRFVQLDDDGACTSGHSAESVRAIRVVVASAAKPTYLPEDGDARRRRAPRQPVSPVAPEVPDPVDEETQQARTLATKRMLAFVGITAATLLIGGGILAYIATRNVVDAYERSLILQQEQSAPATGTDEP